MAVKFWGSRLVAKKKLHVLEKKGWIARLERGKYIVIPLEAGPERRWTEDSYVVAAARCVEREACILCNGLGFVGLHWNL